jgi:pimeloyl-ACP methyl ester carboxylesterase
VTSVTYGELPTISVNGVRLEYRRVAGDPGRATMVLLHEGLGCVALWRDFPERLAAATGNPVFAYSRAGYGGSAPISLPRPLDYMSREATDMLPDVIRAAGITRYILLGHSDGASIALVHAGNAPRALEAIIVMAPHVFTEACSVASIRTVDEAFRHDDLRRRLAKYHGTNVDNAFRGWCDSWLAPDFLAWSIEASLAGITVPLLQIQGRDDEYGTIEQLRAIERGAAGPVKTLMLDACGHAPQFDRAPETLAAVADFCH